MAGGRKVTGKKPDAEDRTTFKQRVTSLWDRIDGRLQQDSKGGIHAAVAAVLLLVLSAALYVPLGLPGYWLSRLALLIPDGSCAAANPPGTFGLFLCGAWLSFMVMVGPLLVILALFLLRGQLRALAKRAIARLPGSLHFLERPVVVTVAFTMAWAGVQFHFFTRWGLIIDGLFPAVIGMMIFVLTFWETPTKKRLSSLFTTRERIPKIGRIALLIGIPALLALALTGWMPFGIRDQLVALLAVFLGWLLWTSAPEGDRKGPERSRATAVALSTLVGLAILLSIAVPVSAAITCKQYQGAEQLIGEFRACEAMHHNATFGAAGGVIAAGSTAVALAPARDEEETDEDAAADPCADLQSEHDRILVDKEQLQHHILVSKKFIRAREQEYKVRKQSVAYGQIVDLGFLGGGLGARILGAGASQAATVMGRIAASAVKAMTPALAKELLKQAFVEGGETKAMEAAYAILQKTGEEAVQQEIAWTIKYRFTLSQAQILAEKGIKEGSPVFEAAMRNFGTRMDGLASMMNDFAGVVGATGSLFSMFADYASLDKFLENIHKFRMNLITLEDELAGLEDALTAAGYDLENCRERVAMGLDV